MHRLLHQTAFFVHGSFLNPTNFCVVFYSQIQKYSLKRMSYCCVPLCKSNRYKSKGDGTAFHEFPTDMKMREVWLRNIPNRDGENNADTWTPTDRSVICSKHFLSNDYKIGLKKPRLLPYAIPSVFPDQPSHKKVSEVQSSDHDQTSGVATNERISETILNNHIQLSSPAANSQLSLEVSTHESSKNVASSRGFPRANVRPILLRKPNISRNVIYSEDIEKTTEETLALIEDVVSSRCIPEADVEIVVLNENIVLKKDQGTVTKLTMGDLLCKARKCRNAKQSLNYLRGKMASMKSDSLQQINKSLRNKLVKYKIDELEKACTSGDKKAMFLLEQLTSFSCKKKKQWSNNTMRCCGAWHNKFPTSYGFMRTLNVLTLPSRSSLRRHSESIRTVSEKSANT